MSEEPLYCKAAPHPIRRLFRNLSLMAPIPSGIPGIRVGVRLCSREACAHHQPSRPDQTDLFALCFYALVKTSQTDGLGPVFQASVKVNRRQANCWFERAVRVGGTMHGNRI